MHRFLATWLALAIVASQIRADDPLAPADKDLIAKSQRLETEIAGFLEKGKNAELLAACKRLVEMRPRHAHAHFLLARAAVRQRELDLALASLETAVGLGFDQPNQILRQPDFKPLHDDKRFAVAYKESLANEKKRYDAYPVDEAVRVEGVRTKTGSPTEGLEWRLRLPAKPGAKLTRLIVWLHPEGRSMNDVVEPLSPRFADAGYGLLTLTRKSFKEWTDDDVEKLLQVTLPDVGKVEGVTAARPILFGHAGGGQLALKLWAASPGKFAGVVVSSAYPLERDAGRFVSMTLPDDRDTPDVPLYVLVGSQASGTVSWRDRADDFRKARIPLTLRSVEGKGHDWLIDDAEVKTLVEWLTLVAVGKRPDSR